MIFSTARAFKYKGVAKRYNYPAQIPVGLVVF